MTTPAMPFRSLSQRPPSRGVTGCGRHFLIHALVALLALLSAIPSHALPLKLGDLDEDGVPTILDVAKLAAHFRGTHPLTPQVTLFADMNQDGALNEADQEALANEILQLSTPRNLPSATGPLFQ